MFQYAVTKMRQRNVGIAMTNFAFPHNNYTPAKLLELFIVPVIPIRIVCKLFLPKITVAFRWNKPFAALMGVPKAPINKNDCFVFRQHNVRFSRKFRYVFPISETLSK